MCCTDTVAIYTGLLTVMQTDIWSMKSPHQYGIAPCSTNHGTRIDIFSASF